MSAETREWWQVLRYESVSREGLRILNGGKPAGPPRPSFEEAQQERERLIENGNLRDELFYKKLWPVDW